MITRYLQVKGTAYERGFQIGQSLKNQIATNLASQKLFYNDTATSLLAWSEKAQSYADFTAELAPDVLAELEGTAAGAELSFAEILYLYTIYERSFFAEAITDKCTSFVAHGTATTDGSVICGQTNDERLDEYRSEMDCVIHHLDSQSKLESLIYTHPGIPAYMGMNNYGLAIMWTYIDNGQRQPGLPTAGIIRQLLQMKTYQEAYDFLHELPHAIPNQFTLAHASQGVVNVECFPNQLYDSQPADILIHANHNSIALTEPELGGSTTSHSRYAGMEEIVNKHYGQIDGTLAQSFLANHINFPKSVCNHPSPEHPLSKSLASMVFDLGKGEFHLAFGNACEMPFKTYRFTEWLG